MACAVEDVPRDRRSLGLGAMCGDGHQQRVVRHGQRGPNHQGDFRRSHSLVDLGPGIGESEAHSNGPLPHGSRRGDLGALPLPVLVR